MTDLTIDNVFDKLDEWRRLPSYQLERRADIYFAMFLTTVLEKSLGTEFECLVIPEFPLRLGTLWPDMEKTNNRNRSVKVDYVAFSKDYGGVFFVELKTSMKSRDPDQDSNLKRAACMEFKDFLEGIHRITETDYIRKHSDKRKKYDCLLKMLSDVPENTSGARPKIVYVQPTCDGKNHQDDATCITFEDFAAEVDGQGCIGNRFAQSLRRWAKDKM